MGWEYIFPTPDRTRRKIMNVVEGKMVAEGIKIGIVASRFNEFIVSKLCFLLVTVISHFSPKKSKGRFKRA